MSDQTEQPPKGWQKTAEEWEQTDIRQALHWGEQAFLAGRPATENPIPETKLKAREAWAEGYARAEAGSAEPA